MIQRIQTLYLLIVATLLAVVLFAPLAKFTVVSDGQTATYALTAQGMKEYVPETVVDGVIQAPAGEEYILRTPYMVVLVALGALLALVVVFLFRNRLAQIRFCFVEMVLAGGTQVFAAFYIYRAYHTLQLYGDSTTVFSLASVLPLVALILCYLALRGVMRDESLVRSLDRIR